MKIYHTETQADYYALLIELEDQGCFWASGGKPPTEWRDEFWEFYRGSTCVGVRSNKQIKYCRIDYYKEEYPDTPIIKYKEKQEGHSVAPEATYISDLSLGGNEMNYLNDAIEEIKRALLNNKSDEDKEVYLRNAIRFIEEAQIKLEERERK